MVKNNGAYLEKLTINEKDFEIILSNEEKLSMWTIIALTHDLGYPLQKAKKKRSCKVDKYHYKYEKQLLLKFLSEYELNILKDSASELTGNIQYTSDDSIKKDFGLSFFQKINVDFQNLVHLEISLHSPKIVHVIF